MLAMLRTAGGRQPVPDRSLGFTLLELLVVMVIIGLLAGYVGPRFFSQIGKSEVQTAKAQMDALGKALDQYRVDVGRYPTTEQGLQVLTTAPPGETRWQGPYLKKAVPPDPWGSRTSIASRVNTANTTSCLWAQTGSRAEKGKTPISATGEASSSDAIPGKSGRCRFCCRRDGTRGRRRDRAAGPDDRARTFSPVLA